MSATRTAEGEAIHTAALLVACPYCHAEIGRPCATAMGTIDRSQTPHNARVTELWRARRRGDVPDPDRPDLFSQPAPQPAMPQPAARASDPSTSHAAAASMSEAARDQYAKILDVLLSAGPLGMTADEIDQAIGWRPTTASRRLPELARQGFVVLNGAERRTRSGRAARAYAHHTYPPKRVSAP